MHHRHNTSTEFLLHYLPHLHLASHISQKIMKTQLNSRIPSLLKIKEKGFKLFGHQPCLWQIRVVESSIPAECAGAVHSIFLAFQSADNMSPRRSQSSGARQAILQAISSIWKLVSCSSDVFKAPKYHPLSLWDNSLISLAYFFFMISLAGEKADFEDFGWSRKASKISAMCWMRSSAHGCVWYLVSLSRGSTMAEAVTSWALELHRIAASCCSVARIREQSRSGQAEHQSEVIGIEMCK